MVRKGCAMIIEINLSNHHYKLLEDISDYTGVSIKEIIELTTIAHIEEFDKAMKDYIENEAWGEYENDI